MWRTLPKLFKDSGFYMFSMNYLKTVIMWSFSGPNFLKFSLDMSKYGLEKLQRQTFFAVCFPMQIKCGNILTK